MHDVDLIFTLTAGLGAALVLGYFTHRVGLSPIVGYLIAGIALGPSTPGFVANREIAEQLAHIGVILLMFGVGLQFHFKELLAVRRVAVPGAIGQSLIATLLGLLVGVLFDWEWSAGLVFGLAISVASTVVLLRVLVDANELHTPTGHIAVGWLVVEDLFTVLVLVLLPVFFQGGGEGPNIIAAVAWSVVKIGVLIASVILVGGRVLPWVLTRIAATRSRELFVLAVLVLALGIALGAAKLFGVSMELGAFMAGMVVGRSDFSSRAASEALPMRDAFAVLFFVSVGMLFNPMCLVESPLLVAATLAIVLVGKPFAALVIVALLRYPLRVALAVSVALAQIGEFSFIVAQLGSSLKILPDRATDALIATAIVSISLNPILYRWVDAAESRFLAIPTFRRLLSRLKPAAATVNKTHDDQDLGDGYEAIVVGYGPVGRTLVRLLQENNITPTIVELNLDTVERLRDDAIRAVYGDSTHKETLIAAGAERANVMILSSAGMKRSEEAIRMAREVNPSIRVIARASYLREVPALRKAGADVVFTGEGEVALTMTEYLMRQFGATAEQIERQKENTRDDLFGNSLAIEILLPPPPRKDLGGDESAT
jgi:CPA2 family monovalent cation:H+ antiporter-2